MFESLTERLTQIFKGLGGKGKLSEADVRAGLREIRQALLAADVHWQVARDLLRRVEEQAIGSRVLNSLTPSQQLLAIVRQEMTAVMGQSARALNLSGRPAVVLLVGPGGSGKTTTAGKLARYLSRRGRRPLLVCCDPLRPAASEQLSILAERVGVPFREARAGVEDALREAKRTLRDVVIVDTPGVPPGEPPPDFVVELAARHKPGDVLLVLDALTGQEAARIAEAFLPLGVTGTVLTKLDGDARGGAALSVPSRTGLPVLFVGVGERPQDLEPFHPARMADRILGLGDLQGLVEKLEEEAAEELAGTAAHLREGMLTLEDFLAQLEAMGKAGSLSQLLARIPGFKGGLEDPQLERDLRRNRAIIQSMTLEERRNPHIIGASRKRRIARGSGTTVQEVNRLLAQYEQARKLVKRMRRGRIPPGLKPFDMG
ncbi:MAG: Signal recognition particle protein [Acetothermia bacterium 64_32]|nr:MAG: Signal recognition particle protein [Acetothermia bacterium 64_32]HAF71554.1 signal recognition particle protein [Candidatus Acetothermia bacterium]